ncbi:hypothetical protein JCM11491_000007 [Sporobolomyces phaffii]
MHDSAPPPYTSPESGAGQAHSASPLLRLPIHLLLDVLSHLSLATLVFTVKPTCTTLYLSVCAVTRARTTVRTKWANGIARNATGGTRRPSTTGILNASTRSSSRNVDNVEAARHRATLSSSRTREERVFDRYIAALARYERDKAESFFLLEGGEDVDDDDAGDGDAELKRSFERDLFGLSQPQARCEDLLIERGLTAGWIESQNEDLLDDSGSHRDRARDRIREDDVRIELKLKTARLLLPVLGFSEKPVWKAFVEVNRLADETLEEVAYHLVAEARRKSRSRIDDSRRGVWYQF